MNSSFKKSVFLAATVAVAGIAASASLPRAHAAGEMLSELNELEGTSNSALTFGSGTNTTFGIGATFSRELMGMIQGSGAVNFTAISYPVGGITSFSVKVGPTYNYSLDNGGLRDAFYLRLLVGLAFGSNSTTGTAASTTNFAYTAQVGKRFEAFPNVFWKPAFDMSGTTASGTNPIFSLIPAQFSFVF